MPFYLGNKKISGSGGSSVAVDNVLSNTSENPVQNKVIKKALESKAPLQHNHSAEEIAFNEGNMGATMNDIESKVNVLTSKESGQNITVTLSTESMENWILVEGYWGGTYISTGA